MYLGIWKTSGSIRKKGQTIGPLDTMFAAHALALNVLLVTNNQKEFSRVP
ncbi:PIN domain-containing protein [Polynucleobacter kasalickyi]